ncbi:hypothetical protein HELRODRAFT_190504 [Helobdella robusta]|uniref:BACK domain-containing protein n=1 Tax=Helobdella robusta TaxID=6412 RepID=T1FS19_HELRO|nr:hypothetical protein HELRODRAFT_190504 [Helobdella robusta]ESO09464.1 hypothetical protein HELRODRAFT_190504 [Helobdella robusta]
MQYVLLMLALPFFDASGQVSPDFNLTEQPLCRLVVSWLLEQNIDKTSDEQLRFFLFLNPDNKLIDCSEELPDRKLNNSNIVKDYKKKCSKKPSLKDKRNSLQHQRQNSSSGTKSPQPPLHQSEDEDDVSTSMVASAVVADKSFICLAVLDQRLVSVSIKFQSDENVRKMSSGDDDNTTDEVIMTVDRNQPQCLMTHLSSMSTARCGFGVGVANGNIIAVGGYDRGECFNTAEIYSPITNLWCPIKPMSTLRGRFSASMLNGKLYACGGSNGTNELNSIEAYDVASDTWINVPDMAIRRSGAGVAVCGNKLFVVGGLCGSKTLSSCEMYDPAANKWTNVANLSTGRSQAAVCSYGETSIVALGGCDAWNFMNTCECYDPLTDTWSFLPSLVVARRGAGAAYFKGMLFVVGGSNEQTTLTSVEIFDPDNNCWFAGPSLGIPRSIMGVTVLEGNRLFVIGGFSGKNFLKSLECLSYDSDEFCSYLPAGSDIESIMRADSIRKFKFQNCMSSRSSHTSSTYSDSPKSPQLDDVANTVTRNINSDSEISSSCSLEDLNKDYHFNHHSTTSSAFGDNKMVNGTAAAAASSLAGDASLSNGGGCGEISGNHVDL